VKYKGALGRRRPYGSPPPLLADEDTWNAWLVSEVGEKRKILKALLNHYDRAWGDWFGLAWALAHDHVPAMSRSGKAGHPQKWDDILRAELRIAVDEVMARSAGRMPRHSALAKVAKKAPWKELVGTSADPASVLDAQYKKAPPQLVDAIRNHPNWEAHKAEVHQFIDRLVQVAAPPASGIKS